MKYCLILILLFFSFSCLNNKKVGLVNDLQKGKLSLNNNLSSTRDTLNIIDSLHFFYSYIKDNDIDQEKFEEVVYGIIQFYNKKDTLRLNQLIHPEIGLYFLYSPGGDVYWSNQKRIYLDTLYQEKEKTFISGFDRKELATEKIGVGKVPIKKVTKNVILTEYMSKTGIFFVDNLEAQKKLTYYINVYLRTTPLSAKERKTVLLALRKAKNIERNTRCIIVSWEKKSDFDNRFYTANFVFYVTKIENKWYLTMIDFSWRA